MANDEAMVGYAIVKCILDYLYSLLEPALLALKALLLAMIAFVDAKILQLRAFLAQFDVLAIAEETAWAVIQALIDYIRGKLLNPLGGPPPEICAEFYQLFSDPLVNLLDVVTAGLEVYRERYKTLLSFMDELDGLIEYWTGIKNQLTALVESVDDAIYWARVKAADSLVAKMEES